MSAKAPERWSMNTQDEPVFRSRRDSSIPTGAPAPTVEEPVSWTTTSKGLCIYKGRQLVALVPKDQCIRLIARLATMIDLNQ